MSDWIRIDLDPLIDKLVRSSNVKDKPRHADYVLLSAKLDRGAIVERTKGKGKLEDLNKVEETVELLPQLAEFDNRLNSPERWIGVIHASKGFDPIVSSRLKRPSSRGRLDRIIPCNCDLDSILKGILK